MSTTVEALEEAQSWLNECSVNPPLREKLRAAIPRAELEGQAVEWLEVIKEAKREVIEKYGGPVIFSIRANPQFFEMFDALLTQIEALKAKDGTTRTA